MPFGPGRSMADLHRRWSVYSPFIRLIWFPCFPEERIWDYVICCKRCGRNIAAPMETMPDQYFVAVCPLCGARRNYLRAELFKGRLSYELIPKRSTLY